MNVLFPLLLEYKLYCNIYLYTGFVTFLGKIYSMKGYKIQTSFPSR